MALQKSITLPNGSVGNYIRLTQIAYDRTTKEASACLMLFTSAAYAASAPDQPLGQIAKLRLQGAKFDEYLSTAALAAMPTPGPDPMRTALYNAAQAEPILPGMGFTRAALTLSDASRVD